jgi:hypothetical protein
VLPALYARFGKADTKAMEPWPEIAIKAAE